MAVIEIEETMDQVAVLFEKGTEYELRDFLMVSFPLMIEEIKELRHRVMFLELQVSSLETELEQERSP